MDRVEEKYQVAENTGSGARTPAAGSTPSRREHVIDAAIEVLGTRGPRALTHRAVDDAAGVPTGTTSNYFRTRDALLIGVTERLEQRDYADWAASSSAPTPESLDQLAAGLAEFLARAVTTDRARTLARYALFLEAQSAPAVLESLQRGHARLTDWAATMLRALGIAEEATRPLVDYLEGAIMHRLAEPHPPGDPEPELRRMLRVLISE
ncbi:TetR/AcrR family transcriptional regulator [Nocardia cyriacigeorgica]|uniref:TetR/AcrR family transcriptional regulator n=1 Tax=Nocardia cyriacigeorgica TaxID=135487 RepID=UPI001E32EC30|nr:TetR/AcrR family transcriptional regulator [Nocardia cyriacigeorgica]